MPPDLTVENLKAALEELGKQMTPSIPNKLHATVCKDQNGVVWMSGAFMDRRAYEAVLARSRKAGFEGPAYDDLPVWDSHQQNIVEIH